MNDLEFNIKSKPGHQYLTERGLKILLDMITSFELTQDQKDKLLCANSDIEYHAGHNIYLADPDGDGKDLIAPEIVQQAVWWQYKAYESGTLNVEGDIGGGSGSSYKIGAVSVSESASSGGNSLTGGDAKTELSKMAYKILANGGYLFAGIRSF